ESRMSFVVAFVLIPETANGDFDAVRFNLTVNTLQSFLRISTASVLARPSSFGRFWRACEQVKTFIAIPPKTSAATTIAACQAVESNKLALNANSSISNPNASHQRRGLAASVCLRLLCSVLFRRTK